jgi:hypothetical protein
MTQRLRQAVIDAVAGGVRAVDRVATQFGVSWPTVMRALRQTMEAVTATARSRPPLVRRLGIDEHRFRTVRWFRDEDGTWRRVEPWMTAMVDLASRPAACRSGS